MGLSDDPLAISRYNIPSIADTFSQLHETERRNPYVRDQPSKLAPNIVRPNLEITSDRLRCNMDNTNSPL